MEILLQNPRRLEVLRNVRERIRLNIDRRNMVSQQSANCTILHQSRIMVVKTFVPRRADSDQIGSQDGSKAEPGKKLLCKTSDHCIAGSVSQDENSVAPMSTKDRLG
jgi:hypothetical protein